MRVIQAKLKGRRPELKGRTQSQPAEVVDLMARLRASLEGTRPARGAKTGKTRRVTTGKTRSAPAGRKRTAASRKRGHHAA
jgi:non-homologous end joining protein Ku